MILKRSDAVVLAAYIEFFSFSDNQKNKVVDNALCEKGIQKTKVEIGNSYAIKHLQWELSRVTNSYLEAVISNKFDEDITVIGKAPLLINCPCCGYKTLSKKGEYDICEVCYWEDDGSGFTEYSSVNSMTLEEARGNFLLENIIAGKFLEFADKKRLEKYEKG